MPKTIMKFLWVMLLFSVVTVAVLTVRAGVSGQAADDGLPQHATYSVGLPAGAAGADNCGWLADGRFWTWNQGKNIFDMIRVTDADADHPETVNDGLTPYPVDVETISPDGHWETGTLWTPQGDRPCLVSIANCRTILFPPVSGTLAQWWSPDSRGLYALMLDRQHRLTERLMEAKPPRNTRMRPLSKLQPQDRVFADAGPTLNKTVQLPKGLTLGPFVGRTPSGYLLFESKPNVLPIRLIVIDPGSQTIRSSLVNPFGIQPVTLSPQIFDADQNSYRTCSNNVSATLSPDGKRLAWLVVVQRHVGNVAAEQSVMLLMVSNLDGSNAHELDHFEDEIDAELWLCEASFYNPVSWLPDGRHIGLRHCLQPNCEYVYAVTGAAPSSQH